MQSSFRNSSAASRQLEGASLIPVTPLAASEAQGGVQRSYQQHEGTFHQEVRQTTTTTTTTAMNFSRYASSSSNQPRHSAQLQQVAQTQVSQSVSVVNSSSSLRGVSQGLPPLASLRSAPPPLASLRPVREQVASAPSTAAGGGGGLASLPLPQGDWVGRYEEPQQRAYHVQQWVAESMVESGSREVENVAENATVQEYKSRLDQSLALNRMAMQGLHTFHESHEELARVNGEQLRVNEEQARHIAMLEQRMQSVSMEHAAHLYRVDGALADFASTMAMLVPGVSSESCRSASSVGSSAIFPQNLVSIKEPRVLVTSQVYASEKSFDPEFNSCSSRGATSGGAGYAAPLPPARDFVGLAAAMNSMADQLSPKPRVDGATLPSLVSEAEIDASFATAKSSSVEISEYAVLVGQVGPGSFGAAPVGQVAAQNTLEFRVMSGLMSISAYAPPFVQKMRDHPEIYGLLGQIMQTIEPEFIHVFGIAPTVGDFVSSIGKIEVRPATFDQEELNKVLRREEVGFGCAFIPAGPPSHSINVFNCTNFDKDVGQNKGMLWGLYMRQFLSWNVGITLHLARTLIHVTSPDAARF